MYLFLIPYLLGFALDCASAFTTAYSRRWGMRVGRTITFILRNILGIPLWFLGLVLALLAPSPSLLPPNRLTEALAWTLLAAGCIPMILGLLELRFRAASPTVRDELVAHGIYAFIRHPIYCGMLLEFLGLAVLQPGPVVLLACVLGLVWVNIQARMEELDLVQRMPAYRAYMQRVPRFLPRLK